MSYYDAMREVMNHAIDSDICNLYFYHVMMGLITKAESEHKFLYDEFMNAKGERAKAENAKLRELVNDMWICISHGSEGWDCTGCRRDPDSVCIGGISEFSQRMEELGIEVES